MADFRILGNLIANCDIFERSSETKGDICDYVRLLMSFSEVKNIKSRSFPGSKQIMLHRQLYHYHRKYDPLVAQVCKNKQKSHL